MPAIGIKYGKFKPKTLHLCKRFLKMMTSHLYASAINLSRSYKWSPQNVNSKQIQLHYTYMVPYEQNRMERVGVAAHTSMYAHIPQQ